MNKKMNVLEKQLICYLELMVDELENLPESRLSLGACK
jgi:hypothetical protein